MSMALRELVYLGVGITLMAVVTLACEAGVVTVATVAVVPAVVAPMLAVVTLVF